MLRTSILLLCNVSKTLCMVFTPKVKRKIVTSVFPCFRLNNVGLKYVNEFKYLVHIISNDKRDDKDIGRDVRCVACSHVRTFWLVGIGCVL